MGYSYEIAKQVLNENDKNRIMCLYLNCNPSAIDWTKAAAQFGCASVDSMRVMTRHAMKKIEAAGGKLDDDGNAMPATPGSAATPRKSGGGGRKRKASTAPAEVGGDADDEEVTPTQKKQKKMGGRKVKGVKDSPMKGNGSETDDRDANDLDFKKENVDESD